LDAILESCAGLDVHQETVVACVLYGPLDRRTKKEIKTFGTTTRELLQLNDWLMEKKCTHVAMESTSVYWKPVWNVLEGFFYLVLGNAQRIKNVPGRKTDMRDAEWIARLLRSGLIEPSFVPPVDIRELRDLTRYRRKLIFQVTAEKNRIHKVLQDANIKLTTYVSDIFGVSGMALLDSLVSSKTISYDNVRSLVKSHLKKKVPQLIDALNGRLRNHHRMMIQMHLDHISYLQKQIACLEVQIDEKLIPYHEEISLLTSITAIEKDAAATIIAEIGTDMSHFPSDANLASWAAICPGNNESAGKKKSSQTLKGNKGLRSILCQVGWAASKTRNTRFAAFYWRTVKRRGPQKAIIAVSHLMLRIIYHILKNKAPYQELGYDYLPQKTRTVNYFVLQIEKLGYQVEIISPQTE